MNLPFDTHLSQQIQAFVFFLRYLADFLIQIVNYDTISLARSLLLWQSFQVWR